ncbi:hypothetical protein BJX63DRAFT_376761 [Aspergillus granulosus]|uniref:Uncharacterized protein n=1 Tax=Aspergillus granulosus TaxID=176169 RepID=A0ABR4I4I7_9EURO
MIGTRPLITFHCGPSWRPDRDKLQLLVAGLPSPSKAGHSLPELHIDVRRRHKQVQAGMGIGPLLLSGVRHDFVDE